MFRAYVHVWTPDYQYWTPVGAPADTPDGARDNAEAYADSQFGKVETLALLEDERRQGRRAAFMGRIRIDSV